MFEARIDFADLCAPVGSTDGGVVFGGSSIRAFRHRLLRYEAWGSDERLVVASWERFSDEAPGSAVELALSDAQLQRNVDRVCARPFDFGLIVVDRARGTIAYRSSVAMTAPIYLLRRPGGVRIDWDYARLLAGRSIAPDLAMALAPIASIPTRSAATMVRDLYRATPDATLTADPAGVTVAAPEPVGFRGPQAVADGVDVEDMLFETVKTLLATRPLETERTAVELSGGMDSALAGMATAAMLGRGVISVGAQFDGSVGSAQRARRRFLCERAGFDDVELPAGRFAPFAPASLRRTRFGVWPEDENFPEIFEAIFALLQTAGVDALVSGLGGDELYFSYEGEGSGASLPVSPSSYLTEKGQRIANGAASEYPTGWLQDSCWLGAAGQTQRALRYGVWPIYPYHAAPLARFIGHLPWAYRRDRSLLRRTLTRVTGDAMFERAYEKESFRPVAFRGMRESRDWLIELLRRSDWCGAGHVDIDRAIRDLAVDPETLPVSDFNSLSILLRVCCFFQGADSRAADAGVNPASSSDGAGSAAGRVRLEPRFSSR